MFIIDKIAKLFVKTDPLKESILDKTSLLTSHESDLFIAFFKPLTENMIFVDLKDKQVPAPTADHFQAVKSSDYNDLVSHGFIASAYCVGEVTFGKVNKQKVNDYLRDLKHQFFTNWRIRIIGSTPEADSYEINIGPYIFPVKVIEDEQLFIDSDYKMPLTTTALLFQALCGEKFKAMFRSVLNKQLQKELPVRMLQGEFDLSRGLLDAAIPYTGRGGFKP